MQFTIFTRLPAELRAQIWLTALGPCTLNMVKVDDFEPPQDHREHFNLSKKLSRLEYSVRPCSFNVTCRESYAVLKPFVIRAGRLELGLPAWFEPTIDVIRCDPFALYLLSISSSSQRIQNLVVPTSGDEFVFWCPYERGPWSWVDEKLINLKSVTFEDDSNLLTTTWKSDYYLTHWVDTWFKIMERFHIWFLEPFNTYVINYNAPTEEWLTPTNFLRVLHNVEVARRGIWEVRADPNFDIEDWYKHRPRQQVLLKEDAELDNPGEWFRKHYRDDWY